jgi:AcrR family transcriptional regulator
VLVTTREDLEQRRLDVSDAACRVLARDGLGALSVRGVAAEAGLPPSTVRYVFPTQAAMREHTITLVFDRTRERIDAIPEGLPDRETARRILLELLPLDDERVVELDVYLALGNAALTDAALRPALDRVVAEMRTWCDRIVALVGVPEDQRADEACRLHALVDGLAVHVTRLAPGESAEWAVDLLDRHLAGLPSD